MSATVGIPAPLRAYADGARELAVDAATVGEALAHLAARYPRLGRHLYADDGTLRRFVNVYVNEEDVRVLGGPDAAIHPGDTLVIVPSIAGGAAFVERRAPLRAP
jgi:adenylyltransferase/sulfurtransferase